MHEYIEPFLDLYKVRVGGLFIIVLLFPKGFWNQFILMGVWINISTTRVTANISQGFELSYRNPPMIGAITLTKALKVLLSPIQ